MYYPHAVVKLWTMDMLCTAAFLSLLPTGSTTTTVECETWFCPSTTDRETTRALVDTGYANNHLVYTLFLTELTCTALCSVSII